MSRPTSMPTSMPGVPTPRQKVTPQVDVDFDFGPESPFDAQHLDRVRTSVKASVGRRRRLVVVPVAIIAGVGALAWSTIVNSSDSVGTSVAISDVASTSQSASTAAAPGSAEAAVSPNTGAHSDPSSADAAGSAAESTGSAGSAGQAASGSGADGFGAGADDADALSPLPIEFPLGSVVTVEEPSSSVLTPPAPRRESVFTPFDSPSDAAVAADSSDVSAASSGAQVGARPVVDPEPTGPAGLVDGATVAESEAGVASAATVDSSVVGNGNVGGIDASSEPVANAGLPSSGAAGSEVGAEPGANAPVALTQTLTIEGLTVRVEIHVDDPDGATLGACGSGIDWGDGTTTSTSCSVECNQAPGDGVQGSLYFEHTYTGPITVIPIVSIYTGSECLGDGIVASLGALTLPSP